MLSIISNIKKQILLYIVSALIFIGGAYVVNSTIERYNSMKNELGLAKRTLVAYNDIVTKYEGDKAVLELKANQLAMSNDHLVSEIEDLRKKKGIKPNAGTMGAASSTTIEEVFVSEIIYDSARNFVDTIQPNDLTRFIIKVENDSAFLDVKINNISELIVYPHKEYVNGYKNGWDRFWHFDWKKHTINRYAIKNTNDLIKTLDTRVVIIAE